MVYGHFYAIIFPVFCGSISIPEPLLPGYQWPRWDDDTVTVCNATQGNATNSNATMPRIRTEKPVQEFNPTVGYMGSLGI